MQTFILIAVLALAAQPARADGPLFSRKTCGYVGLGLSGWMFAEAVAARNDADAAYDRYRRASTGAEAQGFYDDSRRYDTRTVVMGGLGAGALWWSLKMLRGGPPQEELPPPKLDAAALEIKGVDFKLDGDLLRRQVQLTVRRDF